MWPTNFSHVWGFQPPLPAGYLNIAGGLGVEWHVPPRGDFVKGEPKRNEQLSQATCLLHQLVGHLLLPSLNLLPLQHFSVQLGKLGICPAILFGYTPKL